MRDSANVDGQQELDPRALKLIQAALLLGSVLFGLVVWYVLGTGERPPLEGGMDSSLRIAFLLLAVAAVPAILAIRYLRGRAEDYQRQATLSILAWALGEGLAVFGGVIYLLTARPSAYLTGLVVLIASFAIVSAPTPPGTRDLFRPQD